ncbi:MAG: methyl-accepting chemotaxis protein [Vallitaleaceae bacterium]|nr:methyl-accepting chemotaxis protein [Vallitaleaceae bacterium]
MNQQKVKKVFLQDVKVGKKIGVGYAILTTVILVVALGSIININRISHQSHLLETVAYAQESVLSAQIEQANYENDGLEETADKVRNFLDLSLEIARTPALASEYANSMAAYEDQIGNFRSEFEGYVELEKAKNNQEMIRIAIENEVVSDIKRAMDVAQVNVLYGNDQNAVVESFKNYNRLQTALDSFMEVQLSATKFSKTESETYAEVLRNNFGKTRYFLEESLKESTSKGVTESLEDAMKSLDKYEKAFDNFDKLLLKQRQQFMNMSAASKASIDQVKVIEETVEKRIIQVERHSNIIAVISLVLGVLLSIGIALKLTVGITRPLKIILDQMEVISEYDLSQSMDASILSRQDEMGALARRSEGTRLELMKIIKEISKASVGVSLASDELSQSGEHAAATGQEIAATIEDIANGASEQASAISEGVHEINRLAKLIEEDQRQVDSLNEAAGHVEQLKEDGMDIVRSLVTETQISNEATASAQDIVRATSDSAMKIQKASSMIRGIADQTNLLALNAAIEAARAGAAGKGFAVVADEIRKLAEQSTRFTKEIGMDIKELIDKASKAVETMEMAREAVRKQEEDVNRTNAKFNGIAEAIGIMRDNIGLINDSGVEMSGQMVAINNLILSLSAISEQNAAGAQQSSASIVEQTKLLDAMSASSSDLAKLANKMEANVSVFRTESDEAMHLEESLLEDAVVETHDSVMNHVLHIQQDIEASKEAIYEEGLPPIG